MSRASLAVRFPDGTVRYGLYCGTSDMAWPRLYGTLREAWDAYEYRRPEVEPDSASVVPVGIATDYGRGFWWKGTAAPGAIVSGFSEPEDDEPNDGIPGWWRPAGEYQEPQ